MPDNEKIIVQLESNGRAPTDRKNGVVCYLFGVLFAIVFLTTEPYKSNRFVRFHAFQSILFFPAWLVSR
jgi:uncharacterized membrane protein